MVTLGESNDDFFTKGTSLKEVCEHLEGRLREDEHGDKTVCEVSGSKTGIEFFLFDVPDGINTEDVGLEKIPAKPREPWTERNTVVAVKDDKVKNRIVGIDEVHLSDMPKGVLYDLENRGSIFIEKNGKVGVSFP